MPTEWGGGGGHWSDNEAAGKGKFTLYVACRFVNDYSDCTHFHVLLELARQAGSGNKRLFSPCACHVMFSQEEEVRGVG